MKKISIIFLVVVLSMSLMQINVYAVNSNETEQEVQEELTEIANDLGVEVITDGSQETEQEIQEELVEIANDLGVEVITDGSQETMNDEPINLTMGEYEALISEISETEELVFEMENTISVNSRSRSYTSSHYWRKWDPMRVSYLGRPFSLTICRNVEMQYSYNYSRTNGYYFSGYDFVDSWISGVGAQGWTQTSGYANFSNGNKTATATVNGYGYLGIEVEGVNISVQGPRETWKFACKLS